MKPILVNTDYDDVLAGGKPQASRILALEFLAFWLVKNPVRVHRQYPAEYLDYIQQHTGHRPDLRQQGSGENWWGPLKEIEFERRLNSKVGSFQWWQPRWNLAGKVCHNSDDVKELLSSGGEWILKRAQGMSGRGNRVLRSLEDLTKIPADWFEYGAVVEPLRDRVSDLSALWLPAEDKFIFYRNEIDDKFQWRAVVLENGGAPTFSAEELSAMGEWQKKLAELAATMRANDYHGPFSVDAFFYHEGGVLKFHPCSEINARKTMGWIAYQFFLRNSPSQARLSLLPKKLTPEQWTKECNSLAGANLILSPPDAPFMWCWKETTSR